MKSVNRLCVCRFAVAVLAASTVVALPASAQFKNGSQATELKLPTLSQRSIVTQQIGLTDITVNYCRPLAGGRELFGKTIPYGQVWRAGANENTVISFTDDVSVEGKPLAAGTYGLHMIPAADQWTIIFSKNSTSWGSFTYDEKEDALRVTVKPQTADFEEALAYTFEDVKPDSTAVTLHWAKTSVPFTFPPMSTKSSSPASRISFAASAGSVGPATTRPHCGCSTPAKISTKPSRGKTARFCRKSASTIYSTNPKSWPRKAKKTKPPPLRAKALDVASGYQLHAYGRGLQFQKKQDEGFAIFQINIKKRPNEWYTHGELARIASAKGDFPTAVKELNLALQTCPDIAKNQIKGLIAKAEQKQDINP